MTTYKSAAITSLDGSPRVTPSAGKGAPGYLLNSGSIVTIPTGSTSADLYLMVRVPSNVVVKHLWFGIEATATALTLDIGAYYSANTNDGTQAALAGTVIDLNAFAAAVDYKTLARPLDLMNKVATSSVIALSDRLVPLWQALNLTSDPGGMIDITIAPNSTTTDATVVMIDVEYVVGS